MHNFLVLFICCSFFLKSSYNKCTFKFYLYVQVYCITQDYIGFKTELDRREPLYLKLGEKVMSGRALRVSQPEWEKLESQWMEVDEQVRNSDSNIH